MAYIVLLFLVLSAYVPSLSYGANQECCPDGECYDLGPPWQTITRIVPKPNCDVDPVYFILKTSSTINSPVYYTLDNFTNLGDDYDGSKPTAFIFPGWMTSFDSSYEATIIDPYLTARPDANVWFCDYSKIAMNINLAQVVSDIRVVATRGIKFINLLIQEKGTNTSNIHVIGGSLGAHLAAYVAKNISGIGRLTGLDPAGPYFSIDPCEVRFCKTDAVFTEALHTNGNPVGGLGTSNFDSADVDFLASGGYNQPGCIGEQTVLDLLTPQDLLDIATCSHERFAFFYVEALLSTNCTFWGVVASPYEIYLSQLTLGEATTYLVDPEQCTYETCVPFGLNTIEYATPGQYLMRVNPTSPYCVS